MRIVNFVYKTLDLLEPGINKDDSMLLDANSDYNDILLQVKQRIKYFRRYRLPKAQWVFTPAQDLVRRCERGIVKALLSFLFIYLWSEKKA